MTAVQRLQRIEKKIDLLIEKQTKPIWVKSSFIRMYTGWAHEKMRQAKEQGLVEFEKRQDGTFWYNIKSIDSVFLVHKEPIS